jgi:hypothetical protein
MNNIKFTATTLRQDKGHYIARADELSITGGAATTQRGAIRKLKEAVTDLLGKAAEEDKLISVLDAAGYPGALVHLQDITLECHIVDSAAVSVSLPQQLWTFDRTARRTEATGEGRN